MSHRYWANPFPYLGKWTRTREPGSVLGNLDLNRSLVWDPYSGTWTRTWEPVLVYVLKSWPNISDSYGICIVVFLYLHLQHFIRHCKPFAEKPKAC